MKNLISRFISWVMAFFTPQKPLEAPVSVVLPKVEETPTPKKETPRERLLEEAKLSVGKDVTPNDVVSDEVSCSETQSVIIRSSIDPTFPVISYTPNLKKELDSSPLFKQTKIYKPGCIILSPTIEGQFVGHVGTLGENEIIYSVDSRNGLWGTYYNLSTWIKRYRDLGKLYIYFYEPV